MTDERQVSLRADGGAIEGDLALPAGAAWCCSRTAAGRAGTARATGSSRGRCRSAGSARSSSISSPQRRKRSTSARWSCASTSAFSHGASIARPTGSSASQRRERVGYFGASTGAAAALIAAAARPRIAAVVSRGGRPDLAGADLASVAAPTLLIVGGEDHAVLELNRRAMELLAAPKELAVVPGAPHLFEEPGALEEVVRLAADWFSRYL